MLEYWTGPKHDYKFPKVVDWEYKTDTDLYEFAKVCSLHGLILMESLWTGLDAKYSLHCRNFSVQNSAYWTIVVTEWKTHGNNSQRSKSEYCSPIFLWFDRRLIWWWKHDLKIKLTNIFLSHIHWLFQFYITGQSFQFLNWEIKKGARRIVKTSFWVTAGKTLRKLVVNIT